MSGPPADDRDVGLSLDQAPPLGLPVGFFFVSVLAIAAAGCLLLTLGIAPLRSGGRPGSGALTHLGTLGFLGSTMLGALYQMLPVVVGARVPGARWAYGVLGLWAVGVALLVTAFLQGTQGLWGAAAVCLCAAALGFVGPVGVALLRGPTPGWTRSGMRLAVLGLSVVAGLGLTFAGLRAGLLPVPPGFSMIPWRTAHLGLGLGVWVGGLLAAVSWQVLPMFYLAGEVSPRARAAITGLFGASLILAPLAMVWGAIAPLAMVSLVPAPSGWEPRSLVLLALLPAGIAAGLLHPAASIRALRQRRRRRRDETVRFWFAAMACAPLALLCAAAAVGVGPSQLAVDAPGAGAPQLAVAAADVGAPQLAVAAMILAVWGWAGFAMHGMLYRIVPFLVWWHRLSPFVGRVPVPSLRALLPQEAMRRGLLLHGVALLALLTAAMTGVDWVARAAGLALVLTAAQLGGSLVAVLRVRAPAGATSREPPPRP